MQEAQTLTQPLDEYLKIMDKEFGLHLTQEQFTSFLALGYEKLLEPFVDFIKQQLETKIASVDEERLYAVFKDVYLYHTDTLWIKHLDEMEYLRDKVGLMGYAQLDPLVVYKSEAYDKFQNLLYRLQFDVIAYIASIDFGTIQPQQGVPTIGL